MTALPAHTMSFLLGAVLGGVASWAWPRPESPPAPVEPVEHPSPVGAVGADPTSDVPDQDIDAVLRRLVFQRKLLEGQLSLVGGVPFPWPPGLAPDYAADAVRAAAADADAATDAAAVVDIDCSEFPCLVLVEATVPNPSAAVGTSDACDAFSEALGLDGGYTCGAPVTTEAGVRVFGVVSVFPAERVDVERRVAVRQQRALDNLAQRLGEAP